MAKKKSKRDELHDTSDLTAPGYYIVNPAGAIHECTYGHAQKRLKQIGFRLATDAEIERFHEVSAPATINEDGKKVLSPGQRFDKPIAEAYSNDPDEILEQRANSQMEAAKASKEEKEPEKASEPEKDEKDAEGAETPENGDLAGSEPSEPEVVVISEGKKKDEQKAD